MLRHNSVVFQTPLKFIRCKFNKAMMEFHKYKQEELIMLIGIPKEIKANENRVAVTPADVQELVSAGHEVIFEKDGGVRSGFLDDEYEKAGAKIKETAAEVWKAEMVVKVKEPIEEEYDYFYDGLILFTYLHLANDQPLTEALMKYNVSAVGYETVNENGKLPLLTPMSEIAGRFSVQAAAQFLQEQYGGSGILLGGTPGVKRGRVVIIGGGVVGTNAAKMAIGLGAQVTILDVNPEKLAELDDLYGTQLDTLISNSHNIAKTVKEADVVIAGVLIAGGRAPILVTEEMVKSMKPGSVIVDVAVDQGGNFETTDRATTHKDPIYIRHGVIHYTVANIPGAVPRTSTLALTNVTLPYIKQIADNGLEKAFLKSKPIRSGVNVYRGIVTNEGVATALKLDFKNMYDFIRG